MTSGEFNVDAYIYSPYGAAGLKAPGKTCIWLKAGPWLESNNYGDIKEGDRPVITYDPQTPQDAKFRYLGFTVVKAVRDYSGLHIWTNDFVLPKRFDGTNFMLNGVISSLTQFDSKQKTILYELADGKWIAAPLQTPPNRTSFYWPNSANVQLVDTSIAGYDIADITGRPTVGQTLPGTPAGGLNQYTKTILDPASGQTLVQNITSAPTTAEQPFAPQPLAPVVFTAAQLAAAQAEIANEQTALSNGTALPETVKLAAEAAARAAATNPNPAVSVTTNPNPGATPTNTGNPSNNDLIQSTTVIIPVTPTDKAPEDTTPVTPDSVVTVVPASTAGNEDGALALSEIPVLVGPDNRILWAVGILFFLLILLKLFKII